MKVNENYTGNDTPGLCCIEFYDMMRLHHLSPIYSKQRPWEPAPTDLSQMI